MHFCIILYFSLIPTTSFLLLSFSPIFPHSIAPSFYTYASRSRVKAAEEKRRQVLPLTRAFFSGSPVFLPLSFFLSLPLFFHFFFSFFLFPHTLSPSFSSLRSLSVSHTPSLAHTRTYVRGLFLSLTPLCFSRTFSPSPLLALFALSLPPFPARCPIPLSIPLSALWSLSSSF